MNTKINNEGKSLLFSIVGVLTLIVAIAGSTYAFFAVSATNTSDIKGGSAYNAGTLTMTVTQKSAGTGQLVPQLDAAIQKAVTGASGKGTCIDGNGNTICKVYEIVIKNNSTVKLNVNGTLTLTANSMQNLKWAKGTSATSGFPTPAGTYYTKSNTALADTSLNATGQSGDSASYYVVIWISETSASQTDKDEFTGVVTFNGYIEGGDGSTVGGITSTIRG